MIHQIPSRLRSSVTLWSVDFGKYLSSCLNDQPRLITSESSHSTCFVYLGRRRFLLRVSHAEVDHGLGQEAQLTRKSGNHDSERASPVRYETQDVMSTPDTAGTTPLSPVPSPRSVYKPPCAHAHATTPPESSRRRHVIS